MTTAIKHLEVDPAPPGDAFRRAGMEPPPATGSDLRQLRHDADIRRRIARLTLHPMRTLCRGRTALIANIADNAMSDLASEPDASAPDGVPTTHGSVSEGPAATVGHGGGRMPESHSGAFVPAEAARCAILVVPPVNIGRGDHSRISDER